MKLLSSKQLPERFTISKAKRDGLYVQVSIYAKGMDA